MPTSGPYQMPRAQPVLSRSVPYTASCTSGAFDDSTARHYSLSSTGTYARTRHDQGPSWSTTSKSFFPDQASYVPAPQTPQGPFTMNPVDSVYSQPLMTGFEAIAPLDTATGVFNPMVVAPTGRHQVFNEQDMIQDLPMEMPEFGTYLSNTIPYSRHTIWTNGQPSPVGSDCVLANPTMTTGPVNRHDMSVNDDFDMMRAISPYELTESDPLLPYAPVQPRPLRSASERKESSSEDVYQGNVTRSNDNGHEKKKPRSDGLYSTGPCPDGFYRCPFSNIQDCNHKPTKQKCIFE